jgi:PAS domain S-box-containing protein
MDSLARRFALAAVALALSVLLLTIMASWLLVSQQQKQATRILLQKEADVNVRLVNNSLQAIHARLADAVGSSLLANALVDSAGRQTYVVPYLDGMQRVNGIALQLLFVDFEGREIASSGQARFDAQQLKWMSQQLERGNATSAIFPSASGDELLMIEIFTYSRTKTPEGALVYKLSLSQLQEGMSGRLFWGKAQPDLPSDAQVVVPLQLPELFSHNQLRWVQTRHDSLTQGSADSGSTVFSALNVLLFALLLSGLVWWLGTRLALRLTQDLRQLNAFARSVVENGFGESRALSRGSVEVAGLARSINHMLDRLYEQHAQLQHESEERYRLLVEGTNAISWEAGLPSFDYLFVSSQGSRIVGHELHVWQQNQFWQAHLHPDDAFAAQQQRLAALQDKSNYRSEYRFRCADGHYSWLEEIATVLCDELGTPIRLRGILLDIDERKQAENRIIEERQKIDRLKNDFVSTVSHELRTPLTSIRGSLGLVLGGVTGTVPAPAVKLLDIAYKNTERLVRLINDLLDIDKIASGKMDFDLQWYDLSPMIEQAIETNAAYGAQLNVKFVLHDETANVAVKVDYDRMMQVMANLFSNAAKFSPEHGVVDVTIAVGSGVARISVQDHGPGISDEFRAKIFQKFTQQDSSDTRLKGGTGLGLAISQALIEKMGGRIGFESTLGQGTTFYLELPL